MQYHPQSDPQIVADLIELREEAGLTQTQAAEFFDLRGSRSRYAVSAWELGQSRPKTERRSQFIVYLLDKLGLRRNPARFRQVWAMVMVGQWGWPPLSGPEWRTLFPHENIPTDSSDSFKLPRLHLVDWGEAPDTRHFYGRAQELERLQRWLSQDQCRFVAVLGMGGIGKTMLATKLAKQSQDQFEVIIWRSLRDALPLETLLQDYFYLLSNQPRAELPESLGLQLAHLLELLRERRCLLVLDNVEAILGTGESVGQFRAKYERYGEFFRAVGESTHQSCLILTSREKPAGLLHLEGKSGPVRSLELAGLAQSAGQQVLHDQHLVGTAVEWQTLIERFSGNPLLLKLAASAIREVFNGRLADFLKEQVKPPKDVRDILHQQFERLSPLEKEVMFWLAIEREALSREGLGQNLVQASSKENLAGALQALRRRSFIETSEDRLTLQNVVLEYITDRLIKRICREITDQSPRLLHSHALLKAPAKDYLRESQTRLILDPIAKQLLDTLGQPELETCLDQILAKLRQNPQHKSGYAAGNILNLLILLQAELSRFDFSDLTIRQAYLVNANLHDVNFARSQLDQVVFQETFGGVPTLAYSRDGTRLAAGTTSGEVRLWQAETGQPLLSCLGGSWVKAITFSPDDQLLAGVGSDPLVYVWDAHTGQCLQTLKGHTNRLRTVVFSPNGRLLASGGADATIRLWNIETGQCQAVLIGHQDWVLALDFSPDGLTLASGSKDGTVRLWDVQTKECTKILTAHKDWVESVAFSPATYLLASGGGDRLICLWDTRTGRLLKTLTEHTDRVKAVAFSPNGQRLASGSNDRTIRLWSLESDHSLQTLGGHTGWVETLTFSPDGLTLASGGYDQMMRLWEIQSGRCLRAWHSHSPWIDGLAFSPDGRVLASSGDPHTTGLWQIASNRFLPLQSADSRWLWSVAFSPDGRFLASGGYGFVVQWDISTSRNLPPLVGHRDWVRTVAFSPDGRWLASGSEDQTIRIWDLERRECVHILAEHTGRVRSVAFSPTGFVLASGSADQTIRLWDVVSGKLLRILDGHEDWVFSVTFTPDGQYLVSGSADQTVRLWDAASGNCLNILTGYTGPVRSVAVSSDGQWLASGSADQTIRLWDAISGSLRLTLTGHEHWVKSIAFSPDGGHLASASGEGVIKLWDIATGQCLQTLRRDRPYERLNISGATGLTEAQKAGLIALGAVELMDSPNYAT